MIILNCYYIPVQYTGLFNYTWRSFVCIRLCLSTSNTISYTIMYGVFTISIISLYTANYCNCKLIILLLLYIGQFSRLSGSRYFQVPCTLISEPTHVSSDLLLDVIVFAVKKKNRLRNVQKGSFFLVSFIITVQAESAIMILILRGSITPFH